MPLRVGVIEAMSDGSHTYHDELKLERASSYADSQYEFLSIPQLLPANEESWIYMS